MSKLNQIKPILATLVYYDILNRPLTSVEIFKYLAAGANQKRFFSLLAELEEEVKNNFFCQKTGLFFLKNRENLIQEREKRLKISQQKWSWLLKSAKILTLAPFIRLIAVTGSMSADNPQKNSDWDLLIVVKKNHLWTSRLAITFLCELLRKRRHKQLTNNRFCLNCYLTDQEMTITPIMKKHDFHAAQEYGRLVPVLEIEKGIYEKFIQANKDWLNQFLETFPWPYQFGSKTIKPQKILNIIRQLIELLLSGAFGQWLEKKLKKWQIKRILAKKRDDSRDQLFISDSCLMFHPQSKSFGILKIFNQNLAKFEKI